jgi:hypothetical protein
MAEDKADTQTDKDTRQGNYQVDYTVAYLGRLEIQIGRMMELLQRQGERIALIEQEVGEGHRDLNEVKSDVKMLKTTMVAATSEILSLVISIHGQRRPQKAEG